MHKSKKNGTQVRVEQNNKLNKAIWKTCGIEKAVRKYGFPAVKRALTRWVEYQRTNAALLREKQNLEQKIAEIDRRL